ncbi:MAG: hypothetical protein QG602_2067 [Verrucomicrobiota bacterium]|nr:hypothetical protein [Verrucomicrobiota bacterium]
MKSPFTRYLLLGLVLGFTIKAAADDRWETLRAINWVENPTNHTRAGRFGELGPYQFRPTTWRMHTKRPFSQAVQREAADEVAVRHYEWIRINLERAGVDATPFNIAMAWNSGVNNVLKGRVPNVSYDYATRVTNLVQTFKGRAQVVATKVVPKAQTQPKPAVITLESTVVNFAVTHNAPKFELVLPPEPEVPVIYTQRVAEPVTIATSDEPAHTFTFTTAATLTPRFSL